MVTRMGAWAALLILVGIVGVGCGKKGPPVAPERRIPTTVSDLSAVVEGSSVILAWTNPGSRVDGTRMRDLTAIRLYRSEDEGTGEPKPALLSWGKVVGYDEIAAITLAEPGPAKVDGRRVTWVDGNRLTLGRRYVYVVTAVDSVGRSSAPSSRLAVSFIAAPRPPERVTATAGENEVRLAWTPPAALVDGSPAPGVLRYEVLRSGSADGPFAPVTPEPLTAARLTDRGLRNEQTYYYAVRAVRGQPGASARSVLSAVASATPVDLTPPSVPTNLVAVPSEAAVRLAWNASPEEDVAGYIVYRAEAPGGDFVRLTSAPIRTTTYVDRAVARGKTYVYAVTAIDRASRPNESARSEPARAIVP